MLLYGRFNTLLKWENAFSIIWYQRSVLPSSVVGGALGAEPIDFTYNFRQTQIIQTFRKIILISIGAGAFALARYSSFFLDSFWDKLEFFPVYVLWSFHVCWVGFILIRLYLTCVGDFNMISFFLLVRLESRPPCYYMRSGSTARIFVAELFVRLWWIRSSVVRALEVETHERLITVGLF